MSPRIWNPSTPCQYFPAKYAEFRWISFFTFGSVLRPNCPGTSHNVTTQQSHLHEEPSGAMHEERRFRGKSFIFLQTRFIPHLIRENWLSRKYWDLPWFQNFVGILFEFVLPVQYLNSRLSMAESSSPWRIDSELGKHWEVGLWTPGKSIVPVH